jgi:DNA polymerase-1
MEDYCVRDVDINHLVYLKYLDVIESDAWQQAIKLEHEFQLVVNQLHNNGFAFNSERAISLLASVTNQLEVLDKEIKDAFPPKLRLVREVHPSVTRHGTLNRKDFRWISNGNLSEFNGGPFCKCSWEDFNPSSHKQIINILHNARWKPSDKTQTHIELLRKKHLDNDDRIKLEHLSKYGWKVNENNLQTLPSSAPGPARLLARRILLESRRRTFTEWLGLVSEDGRIHGTFQGLGAWTHRMSHQRPNMANIPSEYRTDGSVQFLGKEMRSCWRAPRNKLLAGADAEGIQLRIFAHYIDDEEFTDALVRGSKDEKTDPHSLNQRILGRVCKSRQTSKRFIYALLLGAGIGKLSEILGCSKQETEEALDRLLERYTGFAELKKSRIPADARRGYFIGLDGRQVKIPGESAGERRHLCMSGYLQNGEAIVVKRSVLKTIAKLLDTEVQAILVDVVHDEVVFEVPNSMRKAQMVINCFNQSIEEVGRELKLKCPLKGDGKIGLNWYEIH